MKDENEKLRAEQLPKDPREGTKPVNDLAREYEDQALRVHTVKQLLASSLERALHQEDSSDFLTTGHYAIDDITGGFRKEFVWVVGGDTSWGKSSFAIMVADENIKRGHRVLIVSWEDADSLYGDRLLVRRAGVDAQHFKWHRKGRVQLDATELAKLTQVVAEGRDIPIYLDARGRSVEWVARTIRALVKAEGIDLVLIDYLQAGNNEKPQADRRNQLTYIARTLTDAIKLAGAAGVLFSQITVKDGQKTPNRHSVKESRDVANAAEVIAMGFEAHKTIHGKDGGLIATEGQKVLFLDKVKDGPPKTIHGMKWNEVTANFDVVLDPNAARSAEYVDEFSKPLTPPP